MHFKISNLFFHRIEIAIQYKLQEDENNNQREEPKNEKKIYAQTSFI